MDGFYLVVIDVLFNFFPPFKGFLIFLSRKKEVAIDGDQMDVGGNSLNNFFKGISLTSNINRCQKMIHGFVGLEKKSAFQFSSVMNKPTFNIEKFFFSIDCSSKTLCKRYGCSVGKHGMNSRILKGFSRVL